MKSHWKFAAAAALAMCIGSVAWAGMKSGYPVVVDATARYARGGIGNTRNSTTGNDYIGCYAETNSSGVKEMSCFATDSNGTYVACWSTNASLISMAQSVATDSFLYFTWDAGGTCTYLRVLNASYIAPKTL